MTTMKRPEWSDYRGDGATMDYLEDMNTWIAALEAERDELVNTLRDTTMIATGPCQVPLIDRCRCWRCVNQRVDATLAKFKEPKL